MNWDDLKSYARDVMEGLRSGPTPEPMTPDWTPAESEDLEALDARARARLLDEGHVICLEGDGDWSTILRKDLQ